ncbi:hypothetical protein QT972_18360 [Microcoleus sp. herbarium7]|uniref:hypothetical protein n=1 Tax=Microcoleus sp. herbarium7 TaxID=3055435 RepID=UPI002FD5CEBC
MAQTQATETISQNGIKPSSSKGKRQRKYRSISGTSAESMADVSWTGKVDTQGCEWSQLPTFAGFSTSPDGSFPKVKDSVSSYIDIKTQVHEIDIASGRVYRVYI